MTLDKFFNLIESVESDKKVKCKYCNEYFTEHFIYAHLVNAHNKQFEEDILRKIKK